MLNKNHLVIMAGGVGSRFWPMSTPKCPKQFIDVLGTGKSLLQMTVERFLGVIPHENMWVVTSEKYVELVKEQVPEIDDEHILLEPCMRNTAPCMAYVSYKIRKCCPDANLVFSPSDHIVLHTEKFQAVINKALEFVNGREAIVTLGMKPNRPETGYGYIKAVRSDEPIKVVEEFKEKPSLEIAKRYLADGNYFWNAGIFISSLKVMIGEFERLTPDIAALFESMAQFFFTDREQDMVNMNFPKCRNISIDYGIMERTDRAFVMPADFGWSDLGTWGSLQTHLVTDEQGNAMVANDVKLVDCRNCMVHVGQKKRVILDGLDDYIVAESDEALLVCRKENEQLIKEWQR